METACVPLKLKKETSLVEGRPEKHLFDSLVPKSISTSLVGTTKEEILKEMVMLLTNSGMVHDWEQVLADVLAREHTMSTGMQHGVAIPHAKSDGVESLCVAIGVKKGGIDFGSLDQQPSKLFVMVVSPKKIMSPHLQRLAAIAMVLKSPETVEKIVNASSVEGILGILNSAAAH
jgi:fructose-specific phosphotransferase system IIA component